MSTLLMSQVPHLGGLGSAAIVASLVAPLATAGADAYRTYADSSLSKSELKQRRREFEQQAEFARIQQQSADRQHAAGTVLALRQQQYALRQGGQIAPYVLGAIAFVSLAFVGISLARGGK